ncbi:MAG: adenylate/guanylate cyclase domain-containing protein [Actinomycetota bacterium]|nr:adenylate/guanylate cyclase domain-containing protein [Actinomycetota bacterium]
MRHARSGDVSIAYQVVGDRPVDLVLVHGWVCTFHAGWENPKIARFYRRLASMGRLILFDKRGTGLSDRVSLDHLPDLETRMDDVRAVMEAAGSERAVVLGISEGGPMSTLFAATYPERTVGLVLMGTFARQLWAPDYPIGIGEEDIERRLAMLEQEDWARAATEEWLERTAPDVLRIEDDVRWYVSYVIRGASPGAAQALRRMNMEIDVRHVLPIIGVPTLVLYRWREYLAEATRFMGERIPEATVVELAGNEHLPWEGDQDALLDQVERFLAGIHEETTPDRVLVTVLFTDIVGSTTKAAQLGDAAWRTLLARHDALVRAQLARFRGREISTAGDAFLAVFDGPARAIRCATAIGRAVRGLGLEVRAGVHTGEVELADGDVRGIAVHTGARVAALAGAGEVLVSQTVRDLVAGSGLEFEDRGVHTLTGVPGGWRLLAVKSRETAAS